MENDESSVRQRWRSLEDELEVLRENPVAQALVRDMGTLTPERVDVTLVTLATLADEGDTNGQVDRL